MATHATRARLQEATENGVEVTSAKIQRLVDAQNVSVGHAIAGA